MKNNIESNISYIQYADNLIMSVKNIMRIAKTEEDLKIGFEKLIEPLLIILGVKTIPKYEKSIYHGGRSDALHGQVIIEYEAPRSFKNKKNISHAFEQLIMYIKGETEKRSNSLFIFNPRFVGVGFDGEQIFFVTYCGKILKPKIGLQDKDFTLNGPYPFQLETAISLLIYLRTLSKLPLSAEELSLKFGPNSVIAPKAVSAFLDAFKNWSKKRVLIFFNEWKRLFGIIYGEEFNGFSSKEINDFSNLFNINEQVDFQEILFSVHTYFAFLMKLIAAELLTIREKSIGSSLSMEISNLDEAELINKLNDIEDGGIYSRKGINNFLEGDFFRWYLDAWSPRLKEAIQEIARTLSEFEPATSTLDPNSSRDLLKKLYQYLVPQYVRHNLGEYYTPDWLAELVLNEIGYKGEINDRLLDPACGSGTFLVLAIRRLKEKGSIENLPSIEIAKKILNNIWGFDLNPLAVIASRTNYLFALGDLINDLPNIEIPIYLTDSILTSTKTTTDLFGKYLEVKTSVEKFQIPIEWIKGGGLLLNKAIPLVEEMIKNHYSTNDAIKRLKEAGVIFSYNEDIVMKFYKQILDLELDNKNGIWARFLKNAFAPRTAGQFDFVVGNPPWIRWDYLSKDYREATRDIWQEYGLFSLRGYAQMLGGAKPDFSMLFVYASCDFYLRNKGKLGFLITQEVFKSKGAGEGFRRFQLGDKEYLKILKAHDLVTIQPFEGATNKTAAIFLQKGSKTTYPIPYILWTKKKGIGKIPFDKLLNEVNFMLKKNKFYANPIGSDVGSWQTLPEGKKELETIHGENYYQARAGAWADPYGVFWLEINKVLSDNLLLFTNLFEIGKKHIQKIEDKIEQDLIYPAIRGRDIERWKVTSNFYVLIVNDKNTPMSGYDESLLKVKWPLSYNYLTKFKEILLQRAAYRKFHLHSNAPFYSQYNIGKYTFARYKVVWRRMTTDIFASVISDVKTPFGFKMIIPLDTTVLIPLDNEEEANYLCAILNSLPVRDFIKSYSSAGRGFGTPSVIKHIGIPKYNCENEIHKRLSQISKLCHINKLKQNDREINKLENKNNILINKLFKNNK